MCNCNKCWLPGVALAVLVGAGLVLLNGCSGGPGDATPKGAKAPAGKVEHAGHDAKDADAEVQAERAKLSPEDQRLVAEQEFCVVMDDSRLGSMGPPLKVMVKDTPVFVCCNGCQKKASADPDKTLSKVEELKAKVKASQPKK